MSENIVENEQLTALIQKGGSGNKIYCMSDRIPNAGPKGVSFFDPYSSCARLYWDRFPVTSPNEDIVLIGEGRYADALLEQALMINVLDVSQRLSYRVFGDYEDFRRNHPFLDQICNTSENWETRDRLMFEDRPWNDDLTVLQKADRIILCWDSQAETSQVLAQLRRYCPLEGTVYARLPPLYDGAVTFGSMEELCSPELVMHDQLDRLAKKLHEIYCDETGAGDGWDSLSAFTRRSNMASADHLMTKIRILLGPEAGTVMTPDLCRRAYQAFENADDERRDHYRRMEHERWTRFHLLNNWQYAPVRDNAKRKHPLLVPFDRLSKSDQIKDDYAWELLGPLGSRQI